MNKALEKYKNMSKVMEVAGYCYPIHKKHSDTGVESFFTYETMTWGWGTWKRAWKYFEPDVDKLLPIFSNKEMKDKLDLNGANNMYSMLLDVKEKKFPGWDIRWHASKIIQDGLTLVPVQSLACNIGWDGSGQHCGVNTDYLIKLENKPVENFPDKIIVNEILQNELRAFLLKQNQSKYILIKRFAPLFLLKPLKLIKKKFLKIRYKLP